jgi:hypothetical protein
MRLYCSPNRILGGAWPPPAPLPSATASRVAGCNSNTLVIHSWRAQRRESGQGQRPSLGLGSDLRQACASPMWGHLRSSSYTMAKVAIVAQSVAHLHPWLEMATGTRNPSTRRVLPDKEAGIEWIFYPWVCYWAKSYTHRVCGYGCGCILPIPAYPRVRHTRKNN